MQAMVINQAAAEWCERAYKTLGESKYRVERTFDHLTVREKEILTAIADLPYSPRLSDFTEDEQRRIGKALKEISVLRNKFPPGLLLKEFNEIDLDIIDVIEGQQ